MIEKKCFLNRIILAVVLSFGSGLSGVAQVLETALDTSPPNSKTSEPEIMNAYGKLALHFEANRGQSDSRVKFLTRGTNHSFFLTPTEMTLVLAKREPQDIRKPQDKIGRRATITGTVLRMNFLGANPEPHIVGLNELPGKANYFIGNDPAKWRIHMPIYARVRYEELYSGIDFIAYGSERQLLEYDFVVAPGADPRKITLGMQGADRLEINDEGDLVLHTTVGAIRQGKPFVYQEVDGVRKEIAGGYVLKNGNQVGFEVASYDVSRPLVIDPVLLFSTFVGGVITDAGRAIAVDTSGNAYVTGETLSSNFPTTAGSFDTLYNGGSILGDAFVTKLNPTGSGLVFSTYFGGTGDDQGLGIAVDASGSAYVTGRTNSTDLPTSAPFQAAFGGGADDAFVTKLNPAGSALVYSSYLGGNQQDIGNGIALDTSLNAYVAGTTTSTNIATAGAFDTTLEGSSDGFVTKVNAAGSSLAYSTYLGGSLSDFAFGITVDTSGNSFVTGQTNSPGIATAGAFQTALGGGASIDAFVAKLNPAGSGLVYSTYLGGSSGELGFGIAVDAGGNAYATGQTESADFPVSSGAYDTSLGGVLDAFVTKLNVTGSALVYSTYLGGSSNDGGAGIALDTSGNAFVAGATLSADFPTVTPVQVASGGNFDAFVTKFNAAGSALVYSTYLGGSGVDFGLGIALDALPSPSAYVAGFTGSIDFPTTDGAFQTTFGGGSSDAFVAKIGEAAVPPASAGKVTGGGTIAVGGGSANFGFVVQTETSSGAFKGSLQYVDRASGVKVHSETFTSLTISGNTATFDGTCTVNGTPCDFAVTVTDNGEPGSNDTFAISISGAFVYAASNTLRSGNIQIHE